MPNNQKRKRKRAVSEAERSPAKKAKLDKTQTPKTPKGTPRKERKPNTPGAKSKHPKKKRKLQKKRHPRRRKKYISSRPRLNGLRQKVARVIERALVEAPKIPLIYHLFTERDSMGTPRAPLRQVLRTLKISDFIKNTHLLKENYMKSITNFTTMFSIEEDEAYGGLYLKHWPIFNKDDATVYVDNLPEGCCEDQLMRLAECYGTVAELSISRKGPRWIRPKRPAKKKTPGVPAQRHKHRTPPKKKPLINVGSRPKPFGFIRFVDEDAATSMIREFIVNDPSVFHQKIEESRQLVDESHQPHEEMSDEIPDLLIPGDIEELDPVVPQEFPRMKPYLELYVTRLLREIRFLKSRRKRRPVPMFLRLRRLRRILDDLGTREYRCLRKVGIVGCRVRVRRTQRLIIHSAFPPEASVPSMPVGRAPPPPTPRNNEPSTSDGRASSEDEPIFVNRPTRKKRHQPKKRKVREKKPKKPKKLKPRPKPKRKEFTEKFVNGVLVRKRKRRRRKMSRKSGRFIQGGQVRRFFSAIQVLSLKKYRELKDEYKELVRQEKERVREEAEAPPAPEPEEPQEAQEEEMEVPEMDHDFDLGIDPQFNPEIDPVLDPELEMDF